MFKKYNRICYVEKLFKKITPKFIILSMIIFTISCAKNDFSQNNNVMEQSNIVDNSTIEHIDEKYKMKYVSSDFTNYPLVKLYYKIYDLNNEIVSDFNIKNAILKEKLKGGDYLSREVKIHENIKNYGLNSCLVIDRSGSIGSDMSKIISVTKSFINTMNFNNGDKSELISFDDEYYIDCKFTNDKNSLINAVSRLTPDGTTAFYDAVHCGIQNAATEGGARCVIAFTDGEDNASNYDDNHIINYAKKLQVPIYIIGTGTSQETILKNIAETTGGKYWYIDDLYDMESIFNQIYTIERSTYCIEYISDVPNNNIYDKRNIDLKLESDEDNISFTHECNPVIPPYIGHDTKLDFGKRLSLMYTVYDYPTLTDLNGIDSIPFGSIEQDNDLTNGGEAIDWIVIKRENNKAILLSKLIIDNAVFSVNGSNNWNNSNVREYLNTTCLNSWFSEDEQNKIALNSDGDKISLLTESQCREFFGTEDSNGYNMRIATHCTDYLKAHAKELNITIGSKEGTWYKGNSSFWLRTILPNNNAEYVGLYGKLNLNGDLITKNDGIRPIILVEFDN